MNALCLFFLSYWIHLLLTCLHEWNFPEFVLFSIIIYGLHGINEKTLPRMNHFTMFLFFFFLSYFPMSYMLSYRSKMSSICCPLSTIQCSPLYTMLQNIRRIRYFCALSSCAIFVFAYQIPNASMKEVFRLYNMVHLEMQQSLCTLNIT